MRASKYTSSKIASRLSACASLVRTIVDVGLPKLRYKTVKALIEHVSQSLPTADAGYCEPLILDYFKALAALLEFKAHAEHLSSDDWHELFDFCLDTARDLNRSTQSNGYDPGGRKVLLSHGSRSRYVNTPSTFGEQHPFSYTNSSQLAYPQLQSSNEDILRCVRHLAFVTNAPVVEKAESALDVLLDLLQSYPHSGKIQQSSYEAIYSILSRILNSDTALSLQIMGSLLPLVRTSWQRASQSLRETLLSILLRGQILFPPLLALDDNVDIRPNLIALRETLRDQYCARKAREHLLMEDVDFSDIVSSVGSEVPLSLSFAFLRFGASRGEEPWGVISTCASIYALLEGVATDEPSAEEAVSPRFSAKRQKRTRPFDELLHLMRSPQKGTRIYSLQVTAFLFQKVRFNLDILQTFLDSLLSVLLEDDVLVVSWTNFALARYVRSLAGLQTSY